MNTRTEFLNNLFTYGVLTIILIVAAVWIIGLLGIFTEPLWEALESRRRAARQRREMHRHMHNHRHSDSLKRIARLEKELDL